MTKPTIVKLLFECWHTLHDKTYHRSIGSLIIVTGWLPSFNRIPHNSNWLIISYNILCESYGYPGRYYGVLRT